MYVIREAGKMDEEAARMEQLFKYTKKHKNLMTEEEAIEREYID